MLNETQILLLDNMVYWRGVENSEDKTVEEILDALEKAGTVNGFSATERAVYNAIRNDPVLLRMKVTHSNYEAVTGAKMICLLDDTGQAYAVFAGTAENEWRDNCIAGMETESEQQKKAKKWIDDLPYDDIVATGHSKGGNKAMYVAVTTDKISACYAYDAQGFSREFIEKYNESIKEKSSRIHLRAHSRDFVNILLIGIAGDVKYINNSYGIKDPTDYHRPGSLFEFGEDGTIQGIGAFTDSQDPLMEMLHQFLVYTMYHATPAELSLVLNVVGELMTQFCGGKGGVVREDIRDMFGAEAGETLLKYLTLYLRELQIRDPLKYVRYRNAFGSFGGDAVGGDDFFHFLLGGVVVSPALQGLVFDNITNGRILRMYQSVERLAGGNVRGRDFSQKVKDMMLNAAKETEEEAWWRVDRWDCWYRIENALGGLQWDKYAGRIDEYYRKLIDINDSSVKEIERIFEEVYALDSSYAKSMDHYTSELYGGAYSKLVRLSAAINPGTSLSN